MTGFSLRDKCLTDAEVAKEHFNFFTMNSHPNLLGDDYKDVVTFTADMSYHKTLVPSLSQNSNFFFRQHNIQLKDTFYNPIEPIKDL